MQNSAMKQVIKYQENIQSGDKENNTYECYCM